MEDSTIKMESSPNNREESKGIVMNGGEDTSRPDMEASNSTKAKESGGSNLSINNILRFTTGRDVAILCISAVFITAAGATGPMTSIVFGSLTATFQNMATETYTQMSNTINHYCLYYVYLGIAAGGSTFFAMVGFTYVAQRVTQRIREAYVEAILRQNIGFFDEVGTGEVVGHLTNNIIIIQEGLSDKVAFTISAISTFVTGFTIAFIKSWKMTLALTSTVVVLVTISTLLVGLCLKYRLSLLDATSRASSLVEDVISSVTSTMASNSQEKVAERYDDRVEEWEKWGFKVQRAFSMAVSSAIGILLLNYGLAFWVGSIFLARGEITKAHITTVTLTIINAAFALAQILPAIQGVLGSLASVSKIIKVIDRQSPIDAFSSSGEKPDTVNGALSFRNVTHIYETRPDTVVLDDFSLEIPPAKRTAIVGLSGSGKSTVIELIQRFYDPVKGTILLDGRKINGLNVRWLREQISLVGQEPMLFDTSIYENIAYGLRGTQFENLDEEKKRQMVSEAAEMAHAHDFISALPEGYDTSVGRSGSLLSGGQKQRICIARAIVGDPKVLLLDEATSALDTGTERVVQAALDNVGKGRTTVVIAHRLSTIREADNIVVMSAGRIVEQGTHDELMAIEGTYHGLVQAQAIMRETDHGGEDLSGTSDDISQADNIETGETKTSMPMSSSQQLINTNVEAPKESSSRDPYSVWTIIKFVLSWNRSEHYIIAGCILLSVFAGLEYPVSAVFFGKVLAAYQLPQPEDATKMKNEVGFWCKMYLMLGLVEFFVHSASGIGFAYSYQRVVHRLRFESFRRILRQDKAFFDKQENSAGSLTAYLSTMPAKMATITGGSLGSIITLITTIFAAIVLSTAVAWKVSLVTSCTVPIILTAGAFQIAHSAGIAKRLQATYSSSANFIAEAVSSIRTVASLTRERNVQEHYTTIAQVQGQKLMRSTLTLSALFAVSETATFPCMALVFWWGGHLLAKGEYNITQYYIAYISIIFGSMSATNFVRNSRNIGQVKGAGETVLRLFNQKPEIDIWSTDGEAVSQAQTQGCVEFRNVSFHYEGRQLQYALRRVNFLAKPGQFVALVGPSGSGKSTTLALLERLYNPTDGQVLLDDREVSSLNLRQYRSQIAVVSQEPMLYQGTIRENIAIASESKDVSDEEIIEACKSANIYNFILSLPEGLSTPVGGKGNLLSGGQKQRIAIARALIRKPKLLLLDEATSALDAESETLVNQALETAREGRTTISVSHRLSSIQHADMIYVLDRGSIVENGTHQDLIKRRGLYYALIRQQEREDGRT